RAVALDLAALEDLVDERVVLPLAEETVRVEERVGRVERDDEAERDELVREGVDETAAELLAEELERETRRVDDLALVEAALRDLPELLDAGRVDLRVLAVVELVGPDQVFRQRAPRSFAEDRHVREDVVARLVVLFLLAVLV